MTLCHRAPLKTRSFSVLSILADSSSADEHIDKVLSRRDRQKQKAEREIQRLMEQSSMSFADLPIGIVEEEGVMKKFTSFHHSGIDVIARRQSA